MLSINDRKSQILPLPDISAALRKAVVSSHDYPGHGDVPIVLVAYNASGDIEALDSIGFSISEFPNCHDLLDVQQMHQHYHKRQNARSLTFVLDALDLDFKNLHNAGNDAVYTLQALIAMSTATATGRTGLADDDDDDWDTQEDTDGGGPIPPSMTPRTPRNRRNRGGF